MTDTKPPDCERCAHYGTNVQNTVDNAAWTELTGADGATGQSCCHATSLLNGGGLYDSAVTNRQRRCGHAATFYAEQRISALLVERDALVRRVVDVSGDPAAPADHKLLTIELTGHQGRLGVLMADSDIERLGAVAGRRLHARVGVAPHGSIIFHDWTVPKARQDAPPQPHASPKPT
ncbi:MAG: hypothetical protein OXF01_07715 [Gemmatimonadetes bacterium]|nr:hypothetical protein [Gemmatimonadota bacterium]